MGPPLVLNIRKMKKIWVHKARNFKDAERFEDCYYMEKPPSERLSDIQLCRESFFQLKGLKNASRKGLRRVIRVIQQTQG